MSAIKLTAGQSFPNITVARLEGNEINLSSLSPNYDWRMIVIYRGKHCPLCTKYLSTLNNLLPEFREIGIDVIAVSADPLEKATIQIDQINPAYDVGYGLNIEQMQKLGLYISNPRSAEETDRPFAEPGLFVINEKKTVQIVDISNAPFVRPELDSLLMGLKFIRNPQNNYPIRGTF